MRNFCQKLTERRYIMRLKRTDINGKEITREEIHKMMNKNNVCKDIISNTILVYGEIKNERK